MKSFVTALFMCLGGLLMAQTSPIKLEISSNIDGNSCESDKSGRTILIERTDTAKPEKTGTYQSNGCSFTVEAALQPGTYSVTFSGSDFDTQTVSFIVAKNQASPVIIGPVLLFSSTKQLNEVTVYGNRRQFIKVDSDKTTVNIRDNGMLNSGSSMDAVKKLPGVIKSPGGGLSLNGKGVRIYIDGAPSSLSGSDLENYLATLPANAIEKVELIYNPGAAYDANSSGSIINIVTSNKRMKGINASVNINYNFNKYQKPSPQILLNGKEKNVSWQTMAGFNYIETENRNKTLQEFTYFAPAKTLDQDNLTVSTFRNIYWRTGLNYKLSDRSNLLFNYNMSVANDRYLNDQSTVGPDIDFTNKGLSSAKNAVNELSLQYKTKLDTIGSTLDITGYSNFYRRNPRNEATSLDNDDATYNNSDINFRMNNHYLKYDFSLPFKKWDLTINTGGKYNFTEVHDLGRYNFTSDSDDIFNSGNFATIIDFDYKEKNLAFYGEARKKFGKLNVTAGLRFEDYRVERAASTEVDKIKFNNTNFFPTVNLMYELTKDMNITSSYSRKISQPDYGQIDPNNSNIYNKYNSSTGNLGLRPIFFDNFELKYSAFDYVQAGINYTISKDIPQFVLDAKDGELVSNRSFISIDKKTVFSAFLNFPIPLDYFFKGKEEFTRRMKTIDKMNYIFANVSYVKTMTEGYDSGFVNRGIVTYGAQSQILLPWDITNNMNFFFLPKGIWEIYKIEKPIQEFDISFNKDFLNKKLKVGLHCFDVFNQNEVNALIAARNLNTRFYEKQDSRTFRISVTYNFGNLKLEKDDTNINVDKNSTGGGMMK